MPAKLGVVVAWDWCISVVWPRVLADIDRVDHPGNVIIPILLYETGTVSGILPLHNYSNG